LFSIVIDRDKGALPPIPESDAQLMHVLGLAEMDVVEVHPWRRRSTHTERLASPPRLALTPYPVSGKSKSILISNGNVELASGFLT
jgi:hypothetical protein